MTVLGIRPAFDPLMGTLYGASRRFRRRPDEQLMNGTLTGHVAPSIEYSSIEPNGSPAWLQVVVADINRIALLPYGWDSYGAEQLKQKAAIHAIELLERMDFGGPAPWVSPTKDGGMHLEWRCPDLGLELEVTEHGDVTVVIEDLGEITEWESGQFGDDQLRHVLRRVTSS